jgi:hypothetical protein
MKAPAVVAEHFGRKVGKTAGSYIDDLVALEKAIVLCFSCAHRFGDDRVIKAKGYYKDKRFGYASGKCDDCRQFYPRAFLLIPERFCADPGNRTRSGHSWLPV